MTKSDDKAIAALNELIETCEDGARGFPTAADGVQDPELRATLRHFGLERIRFVSELQVEVQKLGGKPKASGTAVGALHRGWIDLKAAVTNKNDHAIVAECERGEDVAKEMYEKALQGTDIPGTILPIIQRQYASVKAAHDRVLWIRDSVGV